MMTKRDFEAIAAAVFRAFGQSQPVDGHRCEYPLHATAGALADVCAASNPRFDRVRFLKACGVPE